MRLTMSHKSSYEEIIIGGQKNNIVSHSVGSLTS